MKYLYIIFVILLLTSCVPEIPKELNGNWIIMEMKYEGKNVYPETKHEEIYMNFNPVGYEDAEEINFNIIDSMVKLPGFNSSSILSGFKISNNKITFYSKDSIKNNISEKIFFQTYEVNRMNSRRELILTSNRTSIRIIDKNVLFDYRIDEILY